jgi:FlaA1/EpsC-like NDP-sugar epimerase
VKKSDNQGKVHTLEHWQVVSIYLMIYDIIAVNLAYFLALWLRFDCTYSRIPKQYLGAWMNFLPFYTVFTLAMFWELRLYQSLWRFASYSELARVVVSSAVTAVFHTVGITLLCGRMPLSYYFVGAMLQFLAVIAIRFSYRFVLLERSHRVTQPEAKRTQHVMLIGGGVAGRTILQEIQRSKELNDKVCCIIDDNSNKWHRYIDGVPIVGGRASIPQQVEKYQIDKIYLAIPSASAQQRSEILQICKETGCMIKSLPGLYQLANGEVSVSTLKEVKVEDLLGRDPIKVDMEEIFHYIQGKTILVTGGGGSIGSELCRQIAGHDPKQLIIFDIYENNAHAIGLELRDNFPGLNLEVLIGSVRDSHKINHVFEQYHPDIVFHAAAHKHVPLMDDSPCESIKNNTIGTYKTAYAAMRNGCKRFVLISTDKAVNPTNVMGASKRLCEMVIQSFDHKIKEGRAADMPPLNTHSQSGAISHAAEGIRPHTEFVAVRFGNVLGSNGSVIPRFQEQIAKGGPVTVTHPDIIRYFMTIPEAVSLVLQAGTYARGGEIFVLDMGSPVKIDTLARNMIKLSGLRPDIDIPIVYTGLRPGEKLYEEKLMSEEGLRTTPNHLIHIGSPIPFDVDAFLGQLKELMAAACEDREDIRELIAEVVQTYHPECTAGAKQPHPAPETELELEETSPQEQKATVA